MGEECADLADDSSWELDIDGILELWSFFGDEAEEGGGIIFSHFFEFGDESIS